MSRSADADNSRFCIGTGRRAPSSRASDRDQHPGKKQSKRGWFGNVNQVDSGRDVNRDLDRAGAVQDRRLAIAQLIVCPNRGVRAGQIDSGAECGDDVKLIEEPVTGRGISGRATRDKVLLEAAMLGVDLLSPEESKS